MPLPSRIVQVSPEPPDALVGVALALYASDAAYGFVVQRAPDVAGSPGTYGEVARLTAEVDIYIDPIPLDGALYWYRVAHWHDGADDSAYTLPVRAAARVLPRRLARPRAVVPSFREQIAETSTTGTLTLVINDPQKRMVSLDFYAQQGSGAWTSATSAATSGSPTHAVGLVSGQISKIRYVATYYDDLGRTMTKDAIVPLRASQSIGGVTFTALSATANAATDNVTCTCTITGAYSYLKFYWMLDLVTPLYTVTSGSSTVGNSMVVPKVSTGAYTGTLAHGLNIGPGSSYMLMAKWEAFDASNNLLGDSDWASVSFLGT